MRFAFAPHIDCLQDGAAYRCTHCGHELTFDPAIPAREYFRALVGFLRRHRSCPSAAQRAVKDAFGWTSDYAATKAASRAKVKDPGAAFTVRKPAPEQDRPAAHPTATPEALLRAMLAELAPEADEHGRLSLGYLARQYNVRGGACGLSGTTSSGMARRLRSLGLRITARQIVQGRNIGKCLLTGNEAFRRFVGAAAGAR